MGGNNSVQVGQGWLRGCLDISVLLVVVGGVVSSTWRPQNAMGGEGGGGAKPPHHSSVCAIALPPTNTAELQVEKTLRRAALEQYLDGGFNQDAIIYQVCTAAYRQRRTRRYSGTHAHRLAWPHPQVALVGLEGSWVRAAVATPEAAERDRQSTRSAHVAATSTASAVAALSAWLPLPAG
jgi:hypothetical protein